MASTGNIWWMTPLQAFASIGAAANFGKHHDYHPPTKSYFLT